MNGLVKQIVEFTILNNKRSLVSPPVKQTNIVLTLCTFPLHTICNSRALHSKLSQHNNRPKNWILRNKIVHPPKLYEESTGSYVCHIRANIKYSPDKMWYIASFIRGMSVDEALNQLNFLPKKGAIDIKETIIEAREIAVKEHNVQYRNNLWIAESFVSKGQIFMGLRRHARGRLGEVAYKHCHYFLRIEEKSCKRYLPEQRVSLQQLDQWRQEMCNRKLLNSL